MKYVTVREIAEKWNLSVRCVQNYCTNEKIPGAKYIGKQWIIPSDAEPPHDGRTKTARNTGPIYRYHFPLLIYTPYYNDTSELSDDEIILLEAQKLHFEGKFSESVAICSSLLNKNIQSHIMIAVYFTIGFNFALLGLHSDYKKAIGKIEMFIQSENNKREDMKLLLATLIFHTAWDFEYLKKINPEALSEDALLLYKYNLLTKNILSGSIDSETTYHYIQLDLIQLKSMKISPLLLAYHCLLGSGNYAMTHGDVCKYHIGEAVKIAVENEWLSKLSKFYVLNVCVVEQELLKHGKIYLSKLKEFRAVTTRNWQITHQLETGMIINSDITEEKAEYLLLLTYNLSYEQIASIKQLPIADIKAIYKELFGICKVHNKHQLIKYALEMFKSFASDISER